MTKKVKTLEDYRKEEEEKALKMKKRNVWRSLMVLKAEKANISVSDTEVEDYIRLHSVK